MGASGVPREEMRRLSALSPFELEGELITLAEAAERAGAGEMLHAGRGNPNWIATGPREAFLALGQFALSESRRVWTADNLGGKPDEEGARARFDAFVAAYPGLPGIVLLRRCVEYGVSRLGFHGDAWVYELADAIVGDNYPDPNRMLVHCEKVLQAYLAHEISDDRPPPGTYDVFATEGGTAAMCYAFDSLLVNRVLRKGDKIALMTPLFPPYLEIPQLERYSFDVVHLRAAPAMEEGLHPWSYPDEEIDKLADPSIKAVCLVNPSNPASMELADRVRVRIADIVKTSNPNLVIVTDDVYATFVPGFVSLAAAAPYNTLLVYSFSKHYGCTGWRVGAIALQEENVIDQLIAELPAKDRTALRKRYSTLALEPDKVKFIDRLVADSRQVALRHTAGLSGPQQVQMTLFALFDLQEEGLAYKRLLREIVHRRLNLFLEGVGFSVANDPKRAGYYLEIDLLAEAQRHFSADFAAYLGATYEPTDVLFRLAQQFAVVLINGRGFDATGWSIRVSLANLNDLDYLKIGHRMRAVLDDYVEEWKNAT